MLPALEQFQSFAFERNIKLRVPAGLHPFCRQFPLKSRFLTPITCRMNISGSASTLLDSVLNAEATRVEAGVAVLKKAQDVQEQQGEAMVKLIEQAGATPGQQSFSAYA